MHTYNTTQVAKIIGIHPNTVRFYEDLGFIPKPARKPNGYRVFTDLHLEHLRFVRLALRAEVTQNGLRKMALLIIQTAAGGDYIRALELAKTYLAKIIAEQQKAEEAIEITKQLLANADGPHSGLCLTRQATADHLEISIDTLRNWELNGLLSVKRKKNGYRIYDENDLQRLKIIRTLRCANYSLSAILRMLHALSVTDEIDLREVMDTPRATEDIISVCDRLLTSLSNLEVDARGMLAHLNAIKILGV